MAENRLEAVDRMKGIAILLVIIGHLIQFNNIDGGMHNKLFNIIYSFHMPLFFILSGYVASRGWGKIVSFSSFFSFLWKKTYSLLLPLLTWSLFVGKYFFAQKFDLVTVDDILNVVLHPGLWFLQVLFEIQLLFGIFCLLNYYINSQNDNMYVSIILAGLVFGLPLVGCLWIHQGHFATLILYAFCFFMGAFISRYAFLQKIVQKKYIFALSLLSFLLLASHWSIYGNRMDDLLKIIISSVAFIILLHLTQDARWPNIIDSQIQLFGRESLAIYVMQFFLTTNILFWNSLNGVNLFLQFVLMAIIAIPIGYICVFTHRIFEKSDILNFLLYGKKK